MAKRRLAILTIAVVAVCLIVGALARPHERSFSFITVDHPVDIWHDGTERWAYFSLGSSTTAKVAERARSELLAQGYREDHSKKPWIRFIKEDREVVICNHNEFEVNGNKLAVQKRKHSGTSVWPCVLVKNGPGTTGALWVFKAKKLIHGW